MTKANIQVRIPAETEARIEQLAPKSRSEFVRQAIEEKIRRETDRRIEEKWIETLKKRPEDLREAEDWLKAESWGRK